MVNGWDLVAPYCRAPHVAFLGTSCADGSPHVVPVWVDTEGDLLRVNTTEGTIKLENVRRDPRVAVSVHASDAPFFAFTIFGAVESEEWGAVAAEHIDSLSRAYDGVPWPFQEGEEEARVILRIRPHRVAVMSEDTGT